MIKEKAYAKINLILDIYAKRDDGYHNLKSILLPINLYDELIFEVSDSYKLITEFDLPTEDNLITKCYNLIKEDYDIPGCKITLKKHIPTEAGLAGGSADCSATIRGLNKLFNLDIPLLKQEEYANKLGSDTLYCLHNKPSLITSRGDSIDFINTKHNFFVLLIKPEYGFKTKDIFDNFILSKTSSNINNMLHALYTNNVSEIENTCFNNLERVCYKLNPKYKELKQYIESFKVKCHMTGSGSTLFVISDNYKKLELLQKQLDSSLYSYLTSTL